MPKAQIASDPHKINFPNINNRSFILVSLILLDPGRVRGGDLIHLVETEE